MAGAAATKKGLPACAGSPDGQVKTAAQTERAKDREQFDAFMQKRRSADTTRSV